MLIQPMGIFCFVLYAADEFKSFALPGIRIKIHRITQKAQVFLYEKKEKRNFHPTTGKHSFHS